MVGERSSERERSTRDGHPEVKQGQEQHLFFLLLANTKLASHTFHCLQHVPKEIRKLFCKLVPKIKFMGSLLLKYIAHFLMCRKLVSGTCRKLASYKSAGKFPTKHNCGLSSGCFCCFTIRCAGTCFLHFVGNFPTLQYSM